MANTSTRTLRLLSLLQTHKYWPGAELADRLGVSARTLRRDVDRLRDLGYPVEAQRGVDGGYQLAPGAALPPLMVDDEEAVALVVGLHGATQSMVADVAESSVRALAKVVQVMPPRLRRRVEAIRAMTVDAGWPGATAPAVDPAALTTVAVACRDGERLHFAYTAADGRESDRHVEPHRLVSLARRWYLVAYDLTRQDWRSFRLDRVTGARSDGYRFGPRELPTDPAEFVRAGMANLPRPYRVVVIVDAPEDIVRERIGRYCTITPIDSGHCRVTMSADSLHWPMLALGTVGADFHVVEPSELVVELRDWADRFQRAAAEGSRRDPRTPDRDAECSR
ncbi:putative DNA-binding protein [Nocardia nova SH22a]|uniref:Putative DNA-binding protein n=1 Tax=Nocardia nova SH22a TaxID=1415166 RepID=W5TAV3_9NOCA|nr:YafY family protein [Nocardia nova]AHH16470.1 putative DNA-binding protein [Nocardia nova SH22a]